jgi:serine/threonine-protein kinase
MSQPTRTCPTCQTPLPGMAAFCYVCGSATPPGMHRETGEMVAVGVSGIGPVDLARKLQRALGPGYELGERIGAGGFAEVFRARDLRLKRDLAVKVLRPDLGLSPELLQRFRREAETVAALRNAHIVPVYDVGEAEGLAFIIMPLIQGESLRAILDRDGAMPANEVRRILREAAQGLAAAHDAGVVHRDIKPENIMLEGRDKRVLLMDFGIAKAMGSATGEDGDPSVALTTTGIIIGTPQYMSPEQACGDKTIDARTDQYSLAVVAYRMLSGSLPFEGESTRAVLYQQLVADPAPIITKVPSLPPGLANAIQRALAKEPAERFPSMREFGEMVDSETTIVNNAVEPAPRPSNRRGLYIGAGALVLAGVAAVLWFNHPAGAPTTPAPGTAPATSTDSGAPAPAVPGGTAVAPPPAAGTKAPGGRGTTVASAAPGTKNTTTPSTTNSATTPAPAPRAGTGPSCARAADAGDWATAATLCQREADNGNVTAQRILGTMFDKGNGVPEDPAQAVTYYQKASTSDLQSMFLLSRLMEIGRGTPVNAAYSTALLRKAAAGGLLPAQQALAFRLENGAGMKKDEAEAAVWYKSAAEKGDASAQEKFAEFLAKGRGITKNEAEAIDWYKKAADQGSASAAWQLAQIYFKGRGTKKDEAEGMIWLKKAADKNQPDAVKELKKRTG